MWWWNRHGRCAQRSHRKPTDLHKTIARNVAGLIEDGSVVQTGIGGIPDAVLPFSTIAKISPCTANWCRMG